MNAREKNLVALALAVTVAAGGGYWYFNRGNAPGEAKHEASVETKRLPPTRIRLNMMDGEDGGDQGVNLFGYRKPPLVEAVAPPPVATPAVPIAATPVIAQRGNPAPARPATPAEPAVTEVQLTYTGFAKDDDGNMIAFLETAVSAAAGVPAGHYNLREDDFLIGRFRVSKITEASVEVEDMDRLETSARRKQNILLRKLP